MATWLKQSTAVDVKVGPFLDDTDGKTAETALTITQPDIRLAKNGGAWAQKNAAQTLSHEENGWYEISLDTTDTNTLGILIVAVAESGALPVWREFMVVPANTYDSLIGTGGGLQVDTTKWNGTAVATPATAGYPAVTVKDGTGTGEIDTSSGGVILTAAGIDAILDDVVEGSLTLRQMIRIMYSALAGKASGMGTTSVAFRDVADSKARISATVDTDGNRSAVTTDGT